MIFNWFQARSTSWSIPLQYGCTVFFTIALVAFWWFASFKNVLYRVWSLQATSIEREYNEQERAVLLHDLERIELSISTLKAEPAHESSMSVFSWIMSKITEGGLRLETCSTLRPTEENTRQVCVEFVLQGNFESFLSFLKALEREPQGIVVQQCILTRQHDTLLYGKILIAYMAREQNDECTENT